MQHPNPIAEQIEQIILREFHPLRTQPGNRDPHIDGFRAGLTKKLANRDLPMPYRAGTADAASFLDGKAEGRAFNCDGLVGFNTSERTPA